MGGLPRYTVCVPGPTERGTPDYEQDAEQHLSTVLFLLPFARFRADEGYGMEVIMERVGTESGLSSGEAGAELVGLHLESGGIRMQCGSAALGLQGEPLIGAELG